MTTTPNVAQVVGGNVRRLRGDMRQDDLALSLRSYGLRWTQATVAAVESGRREVRLHEVPLLCAELHCSAAELFDGDGEVELVKDVPAKLSAARDCIRGDLNGITPNDLGSSFEITPELVKAGMESIRVHSRLQALGVHQLGIRGLLSTRMAEQSEAEVKAARKLGVGTMTLAIAAYTMWGRTLTEERDARVAETAAADASPRTLQAMRGRVTRELVEELRARIEEAQSGVD